MIELSSLFDFLKTHISCFGPCRRRNLQRGRSVCVDALEHRIVPATVVWTGGSLLNDKWSNPKNWDGEVVPQSGDAVVFGAQAGQFDRIPTNDMTGLRLQNISIESGGYTLKGNAIEVIDAVFASGTAANVIELDIIIPANDSGLRIKSGSTSPLHLAGRISGPANAEVVIEQFFPGSGPRPTVFFTGNKSNSYGTTVVRGVQLGLSRTSGAISVPGDLLLFNPSGQPTLGSTVFINQSEQIRDTSNVQLFGNSRIHFGTGISEKLNSVRFAELSHDGTRILGDGNLTVSTTITAAAPGQLDDFETKVIPIEVRSLKRIGAGTLTFDVGRNRIISVQAAVEGQTGIRKTGVGNLTFGGTTHNTYLGTTFVDAGSMVFNKPSRITALPGRLEIGNAAATQPGSSDSPAVRATLVGNEIVADSSVITVHPNGLLQANNGSDVGEDEVFAELILNGGRVSTHTKLSPKRVTSMPSALPGIVLVGTDALTGLHIPTTTLGIPQSAPVEYVVADGVAANDVEVSRITGNGSWLKRGPGTMVSSLGENTFVQTITVTEGKLVLGGLRGLTTVVVQDFGTLSGGAVVSGLLAKGGGRVESLGFLSVSGNVEFKPFSILEMRPESTTTNQRQLQTGGNVILGDINVQAFPVLDIQPQEAIPLGTKLTVLKVESTRTLTGKFVLPTPANIGGAVLNEGTTFTAGGQNFTISYAGGTSGKDVVVTRNTGPAFVNRALPQTANEGDVVTLRGRITEPDSGDSFRLSVNWGDGKTETFDFPAGSNPNVVLNHKYEQDGNYNVHLDWRDQHGGGNLGDHRIRIRNQPPVIQNISVTSPISRNATATLFGQVRDAGSHDTLRVTVLWGDGSGRETVTLSSIGELQATHTFRRAGRYRITVHAFDGTNVTTTRLWLNVI